MAFEYDYWFSEATSSSSQNSINRGLRTHCRVSANLLVASPSTILRQVRSIHHIYVLARSENLPERNRMQVRRKERSSDVPNFLILLCESKRSDHFNGSFEVGSFTKETVSTLKPSHAAFRGLVKVCDME